MRQHDVVAHEDLKIRNMVKAPAPKPDAETPGSFLPNGAAAQAGLNQSISDAGWGCSWRSCTPRPKTPDGK